MSPRAAWRLEELGLKQVYDFVPGKMAWLAMGWPREGASAAVPNAGEVARRGTPTCALEDRVADVREDVLAVGREVCIVVNSEASWRAACEAEPSRRRRRPQRSRPWRSGRRPSAPTNGSSLWSTGCGSEAWPPSSFPI